MVDRNKEVTIINRSDSLIGYTIPDLGDRHNVRRQFAPRESKIVTFEELQALEDARERRIDQLERSCWDDAIEHHDTALRCFLLKTQARHRGYDQDEAKNAAKDIATAAFAGSAWAVSVTVLVIAVHSFTCSTRGSDCWLTAS